MTQDDEIREYVDYCVEGFNQYRKKGEHLDVLHCAIGVAEEAGEILGIIKKNIYQDKEIDRVAIIEEFGDLLWYYTVFMRLMDTSFSEIIRANRAKLDTRYSEGRSRDIFKIERDKAKEKDAIIKILNQHKK